MSSGFDSNESVQQHQDGFSQESSSPGFGGTYLSPPPFQLMVAPGTEVVQRQEDDEPEAITIDIDQSVGGSGAINQVADVQSVESKMIELGLLTEAERADASAVAEGQNFQESQIPHLIRAITYYQRAIRGSNNPDGRIDPNSSGGTEAGLNAETRTPEQLQSATAEMFNHDRLDPVSIRIIQNLVGTTVDGDLTQSQGTTGAWAMNDDTDSQTEIRDFQQTPADYDGTPIQDPAANGDRAGYIEDDTIAQAVTLLVRNNQQAYALYLVIDYYEDYVDAPGTEPADQLQLNLGGSLNIFYDPSLTVNSQSYDELGGMRSIAVGPGAFTSAATLRTCLATAMTADTVDRPSGMTTAPSQDVNPDVLNEEQRTGVDTGLTDTVRATSISTNSGFFTFPESIRVIQGLVGAPVTGVFDNETITRIAYYQAVHNHQNAQDNPEAGDAANLGTNGELDPTTVELMGNDLISRQQFHAAMQFAMDYFNINVVEQEGITFGDPTNPTGAMREGQSANFAGLYYDPNFAGTFSSDANLNATDPNAGARDVRGTGMVRLGQGAFAGFTTLVTTLSQAVTDVSRPGEGQLQTEGTTRSLIPPLGDMSTFQVPYSGNWRNNGASGWLGATKGGRGGGHSGWDVYAPTGTPIRACCDGTADHTVQNGYGNVVRLFDGTDRVYFYAHLSGFAIGAGQTQVTQGQVLGYVGYTGNGVSQRPHVHFEVRSGNAITAGTRLDPDDYFTRPTKQRFYSSTHEDMIVTEIPNDTEFPYPTPAQQPASGNQGGDGDGNGPEGGEGQ